MKNYWHMMEQVTLSDRKKEEIMEMLENKGTQKRRMPHAGKLILAAALAVGCVLSIAAGLPAQVYNFFGGGTVTIMPGSENVSFALAGEASDPVEAVDGRLWFVADGQKVDITDLVDEDTPYIYERTDPATGENGYVIVGGTPENFGWAEFYTKDEICSMLGNNFSDWTVPIDGENVIWTELTEEQAYRLNEMEEGLPLEYANRPWLDAALAQLELELD